MRPVVLLIGVPPAPLPNFPWLRPRSFALQVEMMLAGKIAPSGVIRPVYVRFEGHNFLH